MAPSALLLAMLYLHVFKFEIKHAYRSHLSAWEHRSAEEIDLAGSTNLLSVNVNPGDGMSVLKAANLTTNLAWLDVSSYSPDWLSNVIPGVARCVAGAIRLTETLSGADQQNFSTLSSYDNEATKDWLLQLTRSIATASTSAAGGGIDLQTQKEAYKYAWRARRELWFTLMELVEKDQALTLKIKANNLRFFEDTLEAALCDKEVCEEGEKIICDEGLHSKVKTIDESLRAVMDRIEKPHLDSKGHYKDAPFRIWKERLHIANIRPQIQSAQAHHTESILERILRYVESGDGQLAFASLYFAKAVLVGGLTSSTYAACDALHRVSDLTAAVRNALFKNVFKCVRARMALGLAVIPQLL
mmetsp:Transcript_94930/g.173977  ORF Transcript_94930/g.173977 Transcript_94930/m.173977 type:complete len:358 (+) Transcript_94930:80-1153(+)